VVGTAASAELISASCRVASAVSAAERPAHTGSPTNRVRRGRRLSVKRRMAGMIRPGLRPSAVMSANDTAPAASPRAARTRSRRRPGTATSTGSAAASPSRTNEHTSPAYSSWLW
jgi:hypothetical protein